jgi:hypothetical protein
LGGNVRKGQHGTFRRPKFIKLTIYLPFQRNFLKFRQILGGPQVAIPHWLRECIQVTDHDQGSEQEEKVLAFPRRTEQVRNDGQSAVHLVYQAAEVVGNLHHHAREIEIRAQTLCRTAHEKLRSAERRAESAENALNLAESRIASAEAKLSTAELRAKNAETNARELDQALTLIEEAIRTRLLGESQGASVSRRRAAA